MNRRRCLTAITSLLAVGAGLPAVANGADGGQDAAPAGRALWHAWKEAHLAEDGRVIDRLQDDASHSEGQGYGLLLATYFGDEDAFRRIHAWTEANLAVREDRLLAWRWQPMSAPHVPDINNASDGDLFYAWGLVRGARAFGDGAHFVRAGGIVEDLAAHCVVPSPEDPQARLLLPAVEGFRHPLEPAGDEDVADGESIIVNPSYYMPLAMRELSAATGHSELAAVAADGERLLTRIALDGLVPDWVRVIPSGWQIAADMSENAGYEAMRVPLFLAWSGLVDHPAVARAARAYSRGVEPGDRAPTVMEVATGEALEYSPDPGYRALAALVACTDSARLGAPIPPFTTRQPYYPATLHLFAMIAATETLQGCAPL